jgi:hypothetical protein
MLRTAAAVPISRLRSSAASSGSGSDDDDFGAADVDAMVMCVVCESSVIINMLL